MQTRVKKWGNSLALRIPRSFAEEAGLRAEAPVKLSVANGRLVVQPLAGKTFSLKQLLAGITPENLHEEWDTGPPMGKEIW